MKRQNKKEQSCIQRYLKNGETKWLGILYDEYKLAVYQRCLALVKHVEHAEDLASDTFVRAFGKMESFKLGTPFGPWVLKIASNLCVDFLRREQRFRRQMLQDDQITEDPTDDSDSDNREVQNLRQELLKLKQPQRRCFCLFYLSDLSYKEIAKLTGYPLGQVRSHIQNARRRLRVLMEQT